MPDTHAIKMNSYWDHVSGAYWAECLCGEEFEHSVREGAQKLVEAHVELLDGLPEKP